MSLEIAYSKFVDWLTQNGGYVSPKVKFCRVDVGQRGVICLEDLPEGYEFLRLPKDSMLLNFSVSSVYQKHFKHLVVRRPRSDWVPLILSLVFERLSGDSFWRPYLDLLPQRVNLPCEWSENDRLYFGKARIACEVQTDFSGLDQRILGTIEDSGFKGRYSVEEYKSLYHDAASLVSAYSFSHPEEIIISMVPFADFLNHKTGFNNARLYFERAHLVMRCISSCRKGEQLFNTYGELGNTELLTQYGFIEAGNPFTDVEIRSTVVRRLIGSLDAHVSVPSHRWFTASEFLGLFAKFTNSPQSYLRRALRIELRLHTPSSEPQSDNQRLVSSYLLDYCDCIKRLL